MPVDGVRVAPAAVSTRLGLRVAGVFDGQALPVVEQLRSSGLHLGLEGGQIDTQPQVQVMVSRSQTHLSLMRLLGITPRHYPPEVMKLILKVWHFSQSTYMGECAVMADLRPLEQQRDKARRLMLLDTTRGARLTTILPMRLNQVSGLSPS